MADGNGLYLYVVPTGWKLWRLDICYNGTRKTLSLAFEKGTLL